MFQRQIVLQQTSVQQGECGQANPPFAENATLPNELVIEKRLGSQKTKATPRSNDHDQPSGGGFGSGMTRAIVFHHSTLAGVLELAA